MPRARATARKPAEAEVIKTTDEDGNEFIQRPIDLNDIPKQAKPDLSKVDTVKCLYMYNGKSGLPETGGYIFNEDVKDITRGDFEMLRDRLGDRYVRELA